MAKKDNNNLKFIVPAIVGLGAGAAFLAKKVSLPGIEKKKSYELLVDAVIHNIMKKQLQADEDMDIE